MTTSSYIHILAAISLPFFCIFLLPSLCRLHALSPPPHPLLLKLFASLLGGALSNRKGVNTPTIVLPISPMTPKDRMYGTRSVGAASHALVVFSNISVIVHHLFCLGVALLLLNVSDTNNSPLSVTHTPISDIT
jgi:hypothetical protein